MANRDFSALFAPDTVPPPQGPQPDFKALFAPDAPVTWGDVISTDTLKKAAPNVLPDLYNTATDVAAQINPFTAIPRAVQQGLHPLDTAKGIYQHFANYTSPETAQQQIIQHPVGTAMDVASVLAGGRGLLRSLPEAAVDTAMPRASVRTEAELKATGGARMNASKLSDATMPAEATAPAFQALQDRLDAGAIDMGAASSGAKSLYGRLRALNSMAQPSPMSPLTKIMPNPPAPVSLKSLHSMRRQADDLVNAGKNPDGSLNTDGFIGLQLRTAVDDMIDAHPEGANFQIGSNEYARYKQSKLLSDAYERATRSATWQNGNEAAALGNEINKILNAKRYKNTFAPEVRKQLSALTQRDLTGLIGALGSKTLSGAAMGRLFEVSIGLPPGTLWPVGAYVRGARNASRREAFQRIQEQIRAGGPVR